MADAGQFTIQSLQTENWSIAALVAAHNAAVMVVTARPRPSAEEEVHAYAEAFRAAYQAISGSPS